MKFIKPQRSIIEKSEYWLYENPVAGIFYWSRLKNVFEYLKKRKWEVILEIGCGDGFFLPSLCQISNRVIGSDIEETFNYSKERTLGKIEKSYANLELKKADARILSDYIDNGSCDVIVAISVLEHINDYKSVIEEVCKCLKPNGIFACVLPLENWFYRLSKKFLWYVAADYRKHYYPHKNYNHRDIRKKLCENFKEFVGRNCPYGIPLYFLGIYFKNELHMLD